MKRLVTSLIATAIVSFGLSGCAGLNMTAKSDYEIDKARVGLIERAAAQYGYQVVWVNPPLKKVAATPGS